MQNYTRLNRVTFFENVAVYLPGRWKRKWFSEFGSFFVQRQAVSCLDGASVEELALLSVDAGARFLFTTALHTKKSLRGAANDWYRIPPILLVYTVKDESFH